MMKICIVTVYNISNCGSVLQAYSMKRLLENYGHDVVFLKSCSDKYVKKLFYSPMFFLRSIVKYPLWGISRYLYGRKAYSLFSAKRMDFSVVNSIKDANADLYILGSDEIWNIRNASFQDEIFYGRGMKNKLAFAVSCGNAKINDFNFCPQKRNLISQIKNIYVRDNNTKQLIEQLTEKTNIQKVLDPTLIDNIGYREKCSDKYILTHNCIIIYAYSLSNTLIKFIKKYAKENKLKIVSVGFWMSWVHHNCICSPLELEDILKQGKCIVTTTFHGSVFSIKSQSRFLVSYEIQLSPKIENLLDDFLLRDRLFDWKSSSYEKFNEILSKDVNYTSVNQTLSCMRNESLNILKQVVGGNK